MSRSHVVVLIFILLSALGVDAQQPASTTMAERTRGFQRTDGFIPFYWDAGRGRVLFEIPAFGQDVLYYVSAATGAGSVEMPFDRGILSSIVIRFERSGSRVLVVAQNLDYRAIGGHAAQMENVRDSFASSVLAALPVEADEGDRVLVDASSLFMRDAANVEGRLRGLNQGAFRFDADRHPGSLGLPEVMQGMLGRTWKAPRDADAKHRSLRRVTQRVALDSMMILGANDDTTPEVRTFVLDQLARLATDIATRKDEDPLTDAHYRQAERDIARYLADPKANAPRSASVAWGGRPRSRYPLHPGPPLGGR